MESHRGKKRSVTGLLNGVVDKMLRLQPVVAETKQYTLAQRRANISAVSMREGFASIRERSEQMSQRLDRYRRERVAMIAKHNGVDADQPSGDELPEPVSVQSSVN